MKNILPNLLIILFLSIACSDNSKNSDDEFADLYGTYRLTELFTKIPSTLNDSGNSYNLIQVLPCLAYNIELRPFGAVVGNRPQLLLNADNTSSLAVFSCGPALEDLNNTWSISGDNLIIRGAVYLIQGDELIYDRDPDNYEYHRIVYKKL